MKSDKWLEDNFKDDFQWISNDIIENNEIYIYDLEYPWTIIGIILHQLSTTLCANDLRELWTKLSGSNPTLTILVTFKQRTHIPEAVPF